MADLEDLRRHDRRAPSAETVERVVRRGRQRRRAAVGVSMSTVVAVGVAVALSAGSGGSSAGLEFVDRAPLAPSSNSHSPAPSTAATTAGVRDGTVEAAADGPAFVAQPAPSSTASPATAPAAGSIASEMRRETVIFEPGDCHGTGVGSSSGWCTRFVGATSSPRSRPVDVTYELCRLGPTPAGVEFRSTKEIDLSVRKPGDPAIWRWSTGRHFIPRRETVMVQPRTCLRWSTTWRTLDQRGQPPAPGQYVINFHFGFGFGDQSPGAYVNLNPDREFLIT